MLLNQSDYLKVIECIETSEEVLSTELSGVQCFRLVRLPCSASSHRSLLVQASRLAVEGIVRRDWSNDAGGLRVIGAEGVWHEARRGCIADLRGRTNPFMGSLGWSRCLYMAGRAVVRPHGSGPSAAFRVHVRG